MFQWKLAVEEENVAVTVVVVVVVGSVFLADN
mgnify:CR=1 FL=1